MKNTTSICWWKNWFRIILVISGEGSLYDFLYEIGLLETMEIIFADEIELEYNRTFITIFTRDIYSNQAYQINAYHGVIGHA